jgi:NADPH:quinone reductase-like Zn-dependent oxidoreductase
LSLRIGTWDADRLPIIVGSLRPTGASPRDGTGIDRAPQPENAVSAATKAATGLCQETTHADAVVDLVGGETQDRSFRVLRRGGKLISAVSKPDQKLAERHGVEAMFFLVNVTRQKLAEIARLIDGGKLKTKVGAVLPLADAREAHLMLERVRPQPKGKIVLAVGAN